MGLRETSGSTGTQYSATGLGQEDYPRNAAFDLSAPDAGLSATGVLRTPQGILDLTPLEMLNGTLDTAFQPVVSWTGHTFTWSPSGGTDPFIILIDGYDITTVPATYLGNLMCVGADNGAMTVPGGYLQQFPYNAYLGVGLYRYAISSAAAMSVCSARKSANSATTGPIRAYSCDRSR